MSSVDLGGGGKGKKGKKKKRRVGFHLDMTPLVDVAFLLLTFFMFATTMAQPQIMEMAIPPNMETVEVAQSNLLTVFVRKDGKIFYRQGEETQPVQPMKKEELKAFAIQANTEKGNELITTLKVDVQAKYANLVEVLDVLNQAEGDLTQRYRQQKVADGKRERKFAISDMTEADKTAIEALP